jgi:hypothetical protein
MGENVSGGINIFTSRDVTFTILTGLVQVAAVAVLACGWRRWKESHA